MIEKITDQNLERYDSRLKEWCDRKFFEKGNYGKYQTTEESGIVTFYPAPNTLLEGKVKFSFKETMPAEGNKGPENPSTITGVSSITVGRCGKNLMREQLQTYNGIDMTYEVEADGTVTFNGTAASNDSFYAYMFNPILAKANFPAYIERGKTYCISASGNSYPNVHFQIYSVSSPSASWGNTLGYAAAGVSGTFTVPNDSIGMIFRYAISKNKTVNNATLRVQIEEGIVETEYERPVVNNYTISLGNVYYGGEIDLTTGVMVVTHYGMIFNGTESFVEREPSTYYRYRLIPTIPLPVSSIDNQICSHFIAIDTLTTTSQHFVIAPDGTLHFITTQTTLSAFMDWVASQYQNGTPLTIAYKLATPYTVSLTPTQIYSLSQFNKYTPRLNTVYTNADSIQISYLKSPIRDEYEKTQAILSLGGNS